jgi:hypothetical protein
MFRKSTPPNLIVPYIFSIAFIRYPYNVLLDLSTLLSSPLSKSTGFTLGSTIASLNLALFVNRRHLDVPENDVYQEFALFRYRSWLDADQRNAMFPNLDPHLSAETYIV